MERDSFTFFTYTEYERLPEFCLSCQIIGHSPSNCLKSKQNVNKPIKEAVVKTRKVFVPKQNATRIILDSNDDLDNNVLNKVNVEASVGLQNKANLNGKAAIIVDHDLVNSVNKGASCSNANFVYSLPIMDPVYGPDVIVEANPNSGIAIRGDLLAFNEEVRVDDSATVQSDDSDGDSIETVYDETRDGLGDKDSMEDHAEIGFR